MRSSSDCTAVTPRAGCVLMRVVGSLKRSVFDSSRERYRCRAFHPNMFAGTRIRDLEFSAGQFDFDDRLESTVTSSNRDSRACTRAAGKGFADSTLVNAQPDVRAIDDFHETHVHSARESWVALD